MKPINSFHAATIDISTRSYLYSDYPEIPLCEQQKVPSRLISDPDLEPAWLALEKRVTGIKVEIAAFRFLGVCLDAYCSFLLVRKESPSEYNERYDKLINAMDLVLRSIAADGELQHALQEINFGNFPIPPNDQPPPSIQNDLEKLREIFADLQAAGPAVERTKSQTAHSLYFVRRLSQFMCTEYGSPLHATVAIVTNSLFATQYGKDDIREKIKPPRQTK